MFVPFQKILPKAIAKLGLTRGARAALVCEKYRQFAPQLIHKDALSHTLPKTFIGKTLTVGVSNSAWAGQIIKQKEFLLKALNDALGPQTVKELKTRVVEQVKSSHIDQS